MSAASFRGLKTGGKIATYLSPPGRHFPGKGNVRRGGQYVVKRAPQRFLNWETKQFGKRMIAKTAVREAFRLGWILSPASKGLIALEALDAAAALAELGFVYYGQKYWKQDSEISINPNAALGGYTLASGTNLCKGDCLSTVSRKFGGDNWGKFEGGQVFCVIASNAPPAICNYTCPTPGQAPCDPYNGPPYVTYNENYVEFNVGATSRGMIILHYDNAKCIIGHDCAPALLRWTLESATWVGASNGIYRMPRVRPLTFTPSITPEPSVVVESEVVPSTSPRLDPRTKPYEVGAIELDTHNRYGHHNVRHARLPARGGTRERKGTIGLRRALQIASRIYGEVTEVGDFVDAIHGALPKKYQVKGGIVAKSKAIYDHIDSLDIGKMGYNLVFDHYSDKALGKLYSYGKKSPYGSNLSHPLHLN